MYSLLTRLSKDWPRDQCSVSTCDLWLLDGWHRLRGKQWGLMQEVKKPLECDICSQKDSHRVGVGGEVRELKARKVNSAQGGVKEGWDGVRLEVWSHRDPPL